MVSNLQLLSETDKGRRRHQRHSCPHTGHRWEGCANLNRLNVTLFSLCSLNTTLGRLSCIQCGLHTNSAGAGGDGLLLQWCSRLPVAACCIWPVCVFSWNLSRDAVVLNCLQGSHQVFGFYVVSPRQAPIWRRDHVNMLQTTFTVHAEILKAFLVWMKCADEWIVE